MTEQKREELLSVPHSEVIQKNGETRIPSIFMFESVQNLFAFLHVCDELKSVVVFENEGMVINPGEGTSAQLLLHSFVLEHQDVMDNYLHFLSKIKEMKWENVVKD